MLLSILTQSLNKTALQRIRDRIKTHRLTSNRGLLLTNSELQQRAWITIKSRSGNTFQAAIFRFTKAHKKLTAKAFDDGLFLRFNDQRLAFLPGFNQA